MRNSHAAFWLAMSLLCLSPFATAACDRDEGPLEEAGEAIDEAGEEIQDEVDDAT